MFLKIEGELFGMKSSIIIFNKRVNGNMGWG